MSHNSSVPEPESSYRLPFQAWLLGVAGLIPFLTIPLLITIEFISYSQGVFYFKQYSALILSFLGGVLWLNALMERHTPHMLYVAMLPSIFGWFAVSFLSNNMALTFLTLSFVSLVFYERLFLLIPKDWVKDYSKLRIILTAVVAASHFVMTILD